MSYSRSDVDERGDFGVVVSLVTSANGTTSLLFDDVSRQMLMDAIGWDHRAFFASLDFPAHELDEVALSQQELARIGENVLFRLLAQAGRLQNGPI